MRGIGRLRAKSAAKYHRKLHFSDGAARVFGVLLGGLYALIYYAPFALIYAVARFTWRKLRVAKMNCD